jgi:hypothetical protein
MKLAGLLALLLIAPAPSLAQGAPSDVELLPSHWSLDTAGKQKAVRQVQRQRAQVRKPAVQRSTKPRIYGGAAMTNGRRERGRGEVGVALPF